MIKRLILAIVLLALIGGGLVGFNLFRARMIGAFFASMPEQAMPVTTVTVAPGDWQPELAAIGTVRAAQGIELTVEGAGIVRSVDFAANQEVDAGQVLLTLDDKTQLADREAARTQLTLAQTTLARARQLAARGVTADANLDSAIAGAEAAEAQLARAEAVLATRTLSAPFGGTIGLPQIDPGSYIAPGTVVATLQDLSQMRVDFALPEQDLENLHIGQPIRAMLDVTGGSTVFAGEITGIDPKVNAASRMLQMRGQLQNAGGTLTPGQFVRVAVVLPQEQGVIALPQTAVMSSLYGDFVYVVRDRAPKEPEAPRDPAEMDLLDRLVAKVMSGNAPPPPAKGEAAPEVVQEVGQVFVQVGRRSGDRVEVLSDNIAPGDVIVSSGQNRLTHGQRVVIDNTVTPDGRGQTPPAADAATDPAADAAGDTETDAAGDAAAGVAGNGAAADAAGEASEAANEAASDEAASQ